MPDTDSKVGGRALQLWLTVLVAMLLGSLGWFSVTVIQMQNDLVKLRTQYEERGARVEEGLRHVQSLLERLDKQHEELVDLRYEVRQLKERKGP